jgi:hypothetical protein
MLGKGHPSPQSRRLNVALFFLLLVFLAVLLGPEFISVPTASVNRANPLAAVSTAPEILTPIRKRAAIVFCGRTGALSQDQWSKGESLATDAARLAWPTIQRHVIETNRRAGWGVDIFFHTWNAEAESELVELLQPRAYSVTRPKQTFTHKLMPPNGGILLSVELALRAMARSVLPANLKAYVGDDSGNEYATAWGDNYTTHPHQQEVDKAMAAAYDRVLLLRFDVFFFHPFLFDKLVEDDAYYVANWCKATGKTFAQSLGEVDQLVGTAAQDAAYALVPEGTHARLCKQLVHFFTQAVEGIPDLYQAGTWPILWRMFNGMADDLERGRFQPSASSSNHGALWGRVQHKGIKIRRYLFHEADLSIVRSTLECAAQRQTKHCNISRWVNRGEDDPMESPTSFCDTRTYFCACDEDEFVTKECRIFAWW